MNLIKLAQQTVEKYVKEKVINTIPRGIDDKFLNRKAGTFVTIKKNGELRGCIGTYLPTRENIAEEVIYNAIAAATEDYRFGPIRVDELPHLAYTVYVLGEPKLEKDFTKLDPKKYGVLVKSGIRSGLLLPDLEGVDTVEQQISIASKKGGIDPVGDRITIYKFEVEKYQ